MMPSLATWSDNDFAQAVVALRTALDNINVWIGCLTEYDVLTITRPQRLARIRGKHRRVSLTADIRLRSTADCQSSSVRSSKTPGFDDLTDDDWQSAGPQS